jgi:hypothetical protein
MTSSNSFKYEISQSLQAALSDCELRAVRDVARRIVAAVSGALARLTVGR